MSDPRKPPCFSLRYLYNGASFFPFTDAKTDEDRPEGGMKEDDGRQSSLMGEIRRRVGRALCVPWDYAGWVKGIKAHVPFTSILSMMGKVAC
jgi:hypothetical protein